MFQEVYIQDQCLNLKEAVNMMLKMYVYAQDGYGA